MTISEGISPESLNTAWSQQLLTANHEEAHTVVDEKVRFDSLEEKIESLTKDVRELHEKMSPVSKIEDLYTWLKDIDVSLNEFKESRNAGASEQRMEDSGLDAISKKIDDLQQYVAGLSTLEEKIQDVTTGLSETKEIVGILVRQLDDLERKYNRAVEEMSQAAAVISKAVEQRPSPAAPLAEPESAKKGQKKTAADLKDATEVESDSVFQGSLPSSVEGIMDRLRKQVSPQTEASKMARALEEIRDKLTTMIPGGTPVLFQMGTVARELKSYPPTATLNENDIARLNKEIRTWSGRLKEMSKS